MIKLNSKVTDEVNFYKNTDPVSLVKEFGSPLYVYNESILRERANEMKNLVDYKNFKINYSAKANSNLAVLQIIHDVGVDAECMSPTELTMELMAGWKPEEILYLCNNVSAEEMKFAIDRNITMSVDSLSQLEQFGKINPGGRVCVRFNTGVGAGHHEKVVTCGEDTKFGVNREYIPELKAILDKYNLTLVGVNHHIGSLFMDITPYVQGAVNLFEVAMNFEDLEFVDLGGGFGVPYKKQEGEARLDLKEAGKQLGILIDKFIKDYGREIVIKCEPGRYISAEAGVLLGEVRAVKNNGPVKYVGTDFGMNVLARPVIYDSHHDMEIYRAEGIDCATLEEVTIVGNICETGDILAKDRMLPKIQEGDIIGILDAGAYGHVMSSNYNSRLRPAEVLIRDNGEVVVIRERDTMEELLAKQKTIKI